MIVNGIAVAAEKVVGKGIPSVKLPSIWGYTFKIFAALCVVLGLILFFFYLLRKVRYGMYPHQKSRKIEVVEVAPLMGKWAVALVRAGRRYFLVGLGENGISLLSSLEKGDLEDESFSQYLREGGEEG